MSKQLAVEFQAAIQRQDIKKAASSRFAAAMDNSTSYIGRNPVRNWSEIPTTRVDVESPDYADFAVVFDRLIRTGGKSFVNAVDPVDGKRPIDAADILQMAILLKANAMVDDSWTTAIWRRIYWKAPLLPSVVVDLQPTDRYSPLIHSILLFFTCCRPISIIGQIDKSFLDWTSPDDDRTALYFACDKILLADRHTKSDFDFVGPFDRYALLDRLVDEAGRGFVDPTRRCLDRSEFYLHSGIHNRLIKARRQYRRFVDVDLAAMILSTVWFVTPVLAIICCYC